MITQTATSITRCQCRILTFKFEILGCVHYHFPGEYFTGVVVLLVKPNIQLLYVIHRVSALRRDVTTGHTLVHFKRAANSTFHSLICAFRPLCLYLYGFSLQCYRVWIPRMRLPVQHPIGLVYI